MKKIVSLFVAGCMILTLLSAIQINTIAAETWLWPIENYYNISSGYGQRNDGWHSGIDIDERGEGYITGKPVRASKSGYATVHPNDGDAGNKVVIDHGDGYVSRYLHLKSIAINTGKVSRGQIIGYAGNTGYSTGPHLHFDIRCNGVEINPMPVDYTGIHTYHGSTAPLSKSICYSYSDSVTAPSSIPYGLCVSVDNKNVVVSWNAVNNAIYYRCEVVRAGDSNFPYAIEPIYTNYTNCSFALGEGTYYVFVTAINTGGESATSDWYCLNVKDVKPIAPVVTGEETVYALKSDTITLSWDSVTYAEKYSYYLGEHPTGHTYNNPVRHGVTTNTTVSFSDLPVGRYVFFVHAENESGSSPQSNWVSIVVNDKDYVPAATEVFNNHIYALYDNWTSWSYAKELCNKMGGHLVTISSKEENDFVKNFIDKGECSGYWMGLTDENQDAYDFKWINGEQFEFTDWAVGDPNNWGEYGNREDYVQIHKNYNYNWIDTSNRSGTTVGFILEVELNDILPTAERIYNGNKYLLFDNNMTWTEAEEYCESVGGHLVTINSSEEYEFVSSFLESGKRDWYFLGATKRNGAFEWIDNGYSVPTLGNNSYWVEGTPTSDTYSNYMMMYKESKKWYELKNLYEYSDHMKHLGFVCEIENFDTSRTTTKANVVNGHIVMYIKAKEKILTTEQLHIALYSEEGRMVDYIIVPTEEEFDRTNVVFADNTDVLSAKVFLWNNLEVQTPIATAEEVKIR